MATTGKPVSAEIEALSAVLGTDASKLLDPTVARAWIALLTAYGRVTRALSSELMDSSGMSLAAVNGWVTRRRCTEDGRVHWATLTPLGVRTFKAVAPAHLAAVAERFGGALPTSDMERLTKDLLKIAAKNAEPINS